MFVRRITGRSMLPGLPPGALIFVRATSPQVGDIVIARLGGREVVKRLTKIEGGYYLVGDNRAESTDSRELGAIQKDAILGVMAFHLSFAHRSSPPAVTDRRGLIVAVAAAGLLALLLVAQLVTFEEFVSRLESLIGDSTGAQFVVALIVISELFALPFLLRMQLSQLARATSLILGYIAVGLWLCVIVKGLISVGNAPDSGLVGGIGHLSLAEALVLIIALYGLLGISSYILHGRAALQALSHKLR